MDEDTAAGWADAANVRTSRAQIYVVGDRANPPGLAATSMEQGRIVGRDWGSP